MRERQCQAPNGVHHEDCPCQHCLRPNCDGCYSTNQDHQTPMCVIRKDKGVQVRLSKDFKRKAHVLKDKNELIYLSTPCHRLKDRSTPKRKFKRVFRSLEELRNWRDENDLIFKEGEG